MDKDTLAALTAGATAAGASSRANLAFMFLLIVQLRRAGTFTDDDVRELLDLAVELSDMFDSPDHAERLRRAAELFGTLLLATPDKNHRAFR